MNARTRARRRERRAFYATQIVIDGFTIRGPTTFYASGGRRARKWLFRMLRRAA